jgi:hypothetical protein
MGAIRPWEVLLCCLFVMAAIAGVITIVIVTRSRRR